MTLPWPQIIGGLLGAIGSQGGGPQTSISTTVPWEAQQPVLKQLFGGAEDLLTAGQPIHPGMSGATAEGLGLQESAARGFGDFLAPYTEAQNFALGDVLSPESNPYLQQYMDIVMQKAIQGLTEGALPALAGGAVGSGGYGGSRQGIAEGLATERAIRAGTEGTTALANQAYGQGLQLLNAALARAPQMAALQFAPGQTLQQTGATREAYDEAAALDPYRRLELVKNIISGNYGGATTSTTPGAQGNPLLSGIGGAIAGGQLSKQFNWPDIFGNNDTAFNEDWANVSRGYN